MHLLEPLLHSLVQARILLAKVLAKSQMSSALTGNQVTVINTKQGTTGLPALLPPAPARQHVLNMPMELCWDSMPSMPQIGQSEKLAFGAERDVIFVSLAADLWGAGFNPFCELRV